MMAGTSSRRGARAMTSSVNWSLLGLVISRASYGLELARRFERTYGEVLPVSGDSHVYSALDALMVRGLVEIVPGPEFGRQPKPHYRATPLGLRGYEDWLVEQVDAERRRQELWVRQLGVFAHDPEAALHVIDRFERQYLKRVGQVGRAGSAAAADPRSELLDELVAEQHRIAVGGMLSWLRSAHERFEAIASTPPAYDPPGT
jgi:DNA-binding PadR family transcriptional regulator